MKENLNIKGRVRMVFRDAATGKIRRDTGWMDNMIMNAGKVAILRRLYNAAAVANEGIITYAAVGVGTPGGSPGEPSADQTTLAIESDRVPVSYGAITGTTLELRAFFDTDEGVGYIQEFGWFGEDASATPDTGTMFNRVVIAGETKLDTETLTISQTITLT